MGNPLQLCLIVLSLPCKIWSGLVEMEEECVRTWKTQREQSGIDFGLFIPFGFWVCDSPFVEFEQMIWKRLNERRMKLKLQASKWPQEIRVWFSFHCLANVTVFFYPFLSKWKKNASKLEWYKGTIGNRLQSSWLLLLSTVSKFNQQKLIAVEWKENGFGIRK